MTGRASPTPIAGIRACVFDAYGTMFDYASASVRNPLSHGLKGPSAFQAARAGLAASSALRLYRAGPG